MKPPGGGGWSLVDGKTVVMSVRFAELRVCSAITKVCVPADESVLEYEHLTFDVSLSVAVLAPVGLVVLVARHGFTF